MLASGPARTMLNTLDDRISTDGAAREALSQSPLSLRVPYSWKQQPQVQPDELTARVASTRHTLASADTRIIIHRIGS